MDSSAFDRDLVRELAGVCRQIEDETLPKILMEAVARIMRAERAVLIVSDGAILSDGHRNLGLQYYSHSPEEMGLSRSVVEAAMGAQKGTARRNEEANPSESMGQHGIRSCVAACIRMQDALQGALYCDVRRSSREFGKEDERNLALVADCMLPILLLLKSRKAPGADSSRMPVRGELIGESASIQRLREDLRKIAPLTQSVLITGPSGAGKDVVAGLLHSHSRRKGRFVAVNCAEFPEGVLASELFGHQKGAFTGATVSRTGLIVAADGGTLFLDEIAHAPSDLQAKLLRVLETREVRPVGSDSDPARVDVRFVFATNRDPQDLVAQKVLLPDLYFRIASVSLHVPSLNGRREDIPLLAARFAAPRRFDPQAAQVLCNMDWPGNVRQLRHVSELARDLAQGTSITANDLQAALDYSSRRDPAGAAVFRVESGDMNFFRLKAAVEEGEISTMELERILLDLYRSAGENWAGVGRKLGLQGRDELKRFDNYIHGLRRRYGILQPR